MVKAYSTSEDLPTFFRLLENAFTIYENPPPSWQGLIISLPI